MSANANTKIKMVRPNSLLNSRYAIFTDGWSKRTAQRHVLLINVNICPDDGPAMFWKVVDTSGKIKDKDFVVQLHKDIRVEMEGCMPLPPLGLLPVLLLPCLPTVMMKFSFPVSHIILLWFHVMVMLRFLPCTTVFLALAPLLPLLLFALNLPRRLEATADALLGMVSTDLLLLLPM
jgi:hypothetical protein